MQAQDTNWKEAITEAMAENGETWADVESDALADKEQEKSFVAYGYRIPFTLWTKNRVYFPAYYDDTEWAASVARYPDGKATEHVGGG